MDNNSEKIDSGICWNFRRCPSKVFAHLGGQGFLSYSQFEPSSESSGSGFLSRLPSLYSLPPFSSIICLI
ncbi:hypothetical protein COCVIDRAFT_116009 [Bipolaris victoriae FI3]|uniref:Uncharacterized protein n=1 Tax=Bipolaris victoriae (strain FI3) TaxID=930091 RepID=W7E9A6_BIPV3|nr:hypothetical protein COCVIDRAFT_116009 [Bipolaris victoriae FI3]